jgi:putative salt-induced outer membrane protein YdiY
MSRLSILPFTLALSLTSAHAWAAPPPDEAEVPEGATAPAPASPGTTEIATGDTFAPTTGPAADDIPPESPLNNATNFDIALGGVFSTGNSRTLAFTGVSNFRLRRTRHQFGAALAGNYGAAGVQGSDRYETTIGNVQGLARYDIFFARDWTAFLQLTARHDPFQGLQYRMNVDPGFAYYAINRPTHRLWFELGYDLQYDIRTDDGRRLRDPDTGEPILDMNGDPQIDPAIDKVLLNHAARAFIGYSNRLNNAVSFDTSLEYLQSVLVAERFRLIYLAALNSQLAERFSLALTFALRYEHQPLPHVRRLDTITGVSLAYRFF